MRLESNEAGARRVHEVAQLRPGPLRRAAERLLGEQPVGGGDASVRIDDRNEHPRSRQPLAGAGAKPAHAVVERIEARRCRETPEQEVGIAAGAFDLDLDLAAFGADPGDAAGAVPPSHAFRNGEGAPAVCVDGERQRGLRAEAFPIGGIGDQQAGLAAGQGRRLARQFENRADQREIRAERDGLKRRVPWPGTKLQKHGAGDPNHNRHWRQRALADEQEQHRGGQSGTARKQRRQPRTPAAERARLDVVELLVEHRSAQAPRLRRL